MFEKITTLILPVAITFIGLGLLYMVFQSRLKHLETKLDTLCTVVNDEVSQRQQLIERFRAPQAPQVGAGSDVPAHPVAMDVTEGQVAGDAEESDSESEGSDYDSDEDTDADSDDGLDADVAEEGNAKLVYESDADAEMIDVSDDEGADVGVVEVLEAVAAAAEPMTHVTVEEVDLDSVEDSVGVIDVSLPAEAETEVDVKADVGADVTTEPAEAAVLPEPQPASPQEFDAAVGQEREASQAAVEEGADDATEYHEPEKHDIETMTEKEMRKLPVAYMRQYMVGRNYTTAAEAKAMRKPEVVNFLMSKRE